MGLRNSSKSISPVVDEQTFDDINLSLPLRPKGFRRLFCSPPPLKKTFRVSLRSGFLRHFSITYSEIAPCTDRRPQTGDHASETVCPLRSRRCPSP